MSQSIPDTLWVVEFRSGTYWAPSVEETHRGVGLREAYVFTEESEADRVASQWAFSGAMVVALL